MAPKSFRTQAGLPLHVSHAANRLRVPERTVRYWAKNGQLKGRKVGPKIWRFEEADVEAFDKLRNAIDPKS